MAWPASRAATGLEVKAVNHLEVPIFYVATVAHALSIMREVASDNLKLQYEIYHQ